MTSFMMMMLDWGLDFGRTSSISFSEVKIRIILLTEESSERAGQQALRPRVF